MYYKNKEFYKYKFKLLEIVPTSRSVSINFKDETLFIYNYVYYSIFNLYYYI
jgi:hypothetical protein